MVFLFTLITAFTVLSCSITAAQAVMVGPLTVDADANSFGCGLASGGSCMLGSTCPTLVDTGLDVNAGDLLEITATGTWTNSGNPAVDADGRPGPGGFAKAPELRAASLIGQIGATPLLACETGAFDGTFYVGKNFSQVMTLQGRLFLGFSDTDSGNNSGAVQATIMLTPPPAVCGNQIVEPDEQCDDGNTDNGDGCSDTCQFNPPLLRGPLQCQQAIERHGRRFLDGILIARKKCLERQLKGSLSVSIDCRGESTDDTRTDNALMRAENLLHRRISSTCEGVILEALGFPGQCVDPDGNQFSVENLTHCLHDLYTTEAATILETTFPLP